MFVDILNKIQPIQFFMESPIWVTIVIFGIIGIFRKHLTVSLLEVDEESNDEDAWEIIAFSIAFLVMAFIAALINVIYVFSLGYVSLSVLTHKGVAEGFPVVTGLCIVMLLSWGLSILAYKVITKLYRALYKKP